MIHSHINLAFGYKCVQCSAVEKEKGG